MPFSIFASPSGEGGVSFRFSSVEDDVIFFARRFTRSAASAIYGYFCRHRFSPLTASLLHAIR